jgi:glutamate--cysteine ligase
LNAIIEKRVSQLLDNNVKQLLKGRRVGLEKESLRVAADGFIAQSPL